MVKNNSGLFLGIAFLGVAGVGAYFYFKEQGIDVVRFLKDGFNSGNAPASLSIGTKELPSETHDEIIMPSKINPSSPSNNINPSSSPSSSWKFPEIVSSGYSSPNGSITTQTLPSGTIAKVVSNNATIKSVMSSPVVQVKQNDGSYGAPVFKASEVSKPSSSITSKAKSFFSRIF